MITRQDYLNNKYTHKEYYAQFVDNNVKARVKRIIGLNRIRKSKGEHLNDILIQKSKKDISCRIKLKK